MVDHGAGRRVGTHLGREAHRAPAGREPCQRQQRITLLLRQRRDVHAAQLHEGVGHAPRRRGVLGHQRHHRTRVHLERIGIGRIEEGVVDPGEGGDPVLEPVAERGRAVDVQVAVVGGADLGDRLPGGAGAGEVGEVQGVGLLTDAGQAAGAVGQHRFHRGRDAVDVGVAAGSHRVLEVILRPPGDRVADRRGVGRQAPHVGHRVAELVGAPVELDDPRDVSHRRADGTPARQGDEAQATTLDLAQRQDEPFGRRNDAPARRRAVDVVLERAVVADGRDLETPAGMLVRRLAVRVEVERAIGQHRLLREPAARRSGIQGREGLVHRVAPGVDVGDALDRQLRDGRRPVVAQDDVGGHLVLERHGQRVVDGVGAVVVGLALAGCVGPGARAVVDDAAGGRGVGQRGARAVVAQRDGEGLRALVDRVGRGLHREGPARHARRKRQRA